MRSRRSVRCGRSASRAQTSRFRTSRAVVAACDEADGDAVNTLVFRDGRVLGFNTDREILAGIDATCACVIGAGGAARALAPALPQETRVYSRSGAWPPDASGCDLIVNATPVRDELLVSPHAGQTVVDLAYGPEDTALVAAARAAGCAVIDGARGTRSTGCSELPPLDRARPTGRRDARGRQALARRQDSAKGPTAIDVGPLH